MPMIDLEIAKAREAVEDAIYVVEQARKDRDAKRIKESNGKYRIAVARLQGLEARKRAIQRPDVPHPEIAYKQVGPPAQVGGNAVQGIMMRASRSKARKKKAKKKQTKRAKSKSSKHSKRRKE